METSADIDVTSGAGSLPADFLAERRLYWSSDPVGQPDFMAPEAFWADARASQSGASIPEVYTIEGSTLRVAPSATGTAKLLYYKAYAALAADSDSNWLLLNAPGVYLWAATIEAAQFARNAERASMALASYQTAAEALKNAENLARFSHQMAKRVPGT